VALLASDTDPYSSANRVSNDSGHVFPHGNDDANQYADGDQYKHSVTRHANIYPNLYS